MLTTSPHAALMVAGRCPRRGRYHCASGIRLQSNRLSFEHWVPSMHAVRSRRRCGCRGYSGWRKPARPRCPRKSPCPRFSANWPKRLADRSSLRPWMCRWTNQPGRGSCHRCRNKSKRAQEDRQRARQSIAELHAKLPALPRHRSAAEQSFPKWRAAKTPKQWRKRSLGFGLYRTAPSGGAR